MQSGYKTRQRQMITELLRSRADCHFTVDDICKQLYDVGRSTVYRCLERMVSEGTVRKYTASSGDSACYQYISDECCREHFHLKCEKCGKLIHIECEHLDELNSHISAHHGFKINRLKTVLYGICKDCLNK